MTMTTLEHKMYQILGAVSATDAPIVFVGGLVTKLILAESGYSVLERPTVDIDANWVGAPPSMNGLVDTINRSLAPFGGELLAKAKREYSCGQTAGVSIIDTATEDVMLTMDIDVRPVLGSRIYHYGEIGICGVLPTEILADKVYVLSGRTVFRRAKDLVDVYALAHCVCLSTSELYDALESKGRTLGTFYEFHSMRHDLEHAYDRLAGIGGKPEFDELYSYLATFVAPFALKDKTPKSWSIDSATWEQIIKRA